MTLLTFYRKGAELESNLYYSVHATAHVWISSTGVPTECSSLSTEAIRITELARRAFTNSTFGRKLQGVLQVVFQACSLHGKGPQNDKQNAQMKFSFHGVSERKTKNRVGELQLKNQNGTSSVKNGTNDD